MDTIFVFVYYRKEKKGGSCEKKNILVRHKIIDYVQKLRSHENFRY